MAPESLKGTVGKSQSSLLERTRPTIVIEHKADERLRQGEFYSDIDIIESFSDGKKSIFIDEINYPLCILLNQDCDLNSDFRSRTTKEEDPKSNNDKDILWLVFAPVYVFAQFLQGDHLTELGMKMSKLEDNTLISKILQNEIPRFHFLKFEAKEKLPEMIIDFKHFFTKSNTSFLKDTKKKLEFSALPLFREAISQRFAYYLSRIGLPEIKQ